MAAIKEIVLEDRTITNKKLHKKLLSQVETFGRKIHRG